MSDLGWNENRRIRFYGDKGPVVIVLHGGPGASGNAAPIAMGLSRHFRVIEPWQRIKGGTPLTVAVHIADLRLLIESRCKDEKPILVGESWGAMLALAYASEYPETVSSLVLVGCGTFDKKSRGQALQTRLDRIQDYIDRHPEYKADLRLDPSMQVMKWHEMTDNYRPDPAREGYPPAEPFNMPAHKETWTDMIRCQDQGKYPGAFSAVASPVLMLHGDYDPHPGKSTRNLLKLYIPHLEYHEFERCGHSPWIEKYAQDEFFKVMTGWLNRLIKHPEQ